MIAPDIVETAFDVIKAAIDATKIHEHWSVDELQRHKETHHPLAAALRDRLAALHYSAVFHAAALTPPLPQPTYGRGSVVDDVPTAAYRGWPTSNAIPTP